MSARIKFHEKNLWFTDPEGSPATPTLRFTAPFVVNIRYGSGDPRDEATNKYLKNKWVCEIHSGNDGGGNWMVAEGAHPTREGAEKMAPIVLALAYARFGKYIHE